VCHHRRGQFRVRLEVWRPRLAIIRMGRAVELLPTRLAPMVDLAAEATGITATDRPMAGVDTQRHRTAPVRTGVIMAARVEATTPARAITAVLVEAPMVAAVADHTAEERTAAKQLLRSGKTPPGFRRRFFCRAPRSAK
jgi:hypothetical protein